MYTLATATRNPLPSRCLEHVCFQLIIPQMVTKISILPHFEIGSHMVAQNYAVTLFHWQQSSCLSLLSAEIQASATMTYFFMCVVVELNQSQASILSTTDLYPGLLLVFHCNFTCLWAVQMSNTAGMFLYIPLLLSFINPHHIVWLPCSFSEL